MKMDPKKFNIRVYGLLINERNELLVSDELIRGMHFTKFPGGGLEWGEGLIDGLKREFMEEMGQPVEVIAHYYTTDYFQVSAFNENDQLISIYYRVSLVGEPVFVPKTKAFDFPEGHAGELNVFRWVPLEHLSQDDFKWPVDRIVAEMLQREYRINSY